MKIMISACLAGEYCKYDGGNNRNGTVTALFAGNELIAVCPEVLGGLPTPRIPAEIREGCVVKSRSPSCGVKQRYDGSFSGRLTDAPGVTAQLLAEHGFRVIDAEDL